MRLPLQITSRQMQPSLALEARIPMLVRRLEKFSEHITRCCVIVEPPAHIACGTHGRRGIARLLMGSDAEQVVRQSPIPVLLIRAIAAK